MNKHHKRFVLGVAGILLFLLNGISHSQNLESFEEKVTEFTLNNGLHFIVIERPVAPVASFVTFVNVGGANEPVGNTGVAHIFEHMAFKGTNTIGTTDWKLEKQMIENVDQAYVNWLEEKYRPDPDEKRLEELWQQFEELQEESKKYAESDEFTQIIEQNGGTGINAFTSSDGTAYFYSLPQNRAELWFSLESDRFLNPVFREFYVEKDVIHEERRMRTDSSPVGRLLEEFLSVAFSAHPYGNPVVGWASDIEATTIAETRRFFEQFYSPSNITIAIAGDIEADRMRELAEEYFGRMRKGDKIPELRTIEPEQRGERRFIIEEDSQPFLLSGYHTVSQTHPDFAALQLVGAIISDGRTSRLYKRLVEEDKLALGVQAFNGFPGTKYPGLFLTLAVPNQGIPVEEVETAIYEEIDRVKDGDIKQEELARALTNARASHVRSLNNNTGLALNFAQTHAQRGNWRRAFTYLEDLNSVTLEDLQRVAQTYFVKKNRTVGMIKNREQEEEATASKEN